MAWLSCSTSIGTYKTVTVPAWFWGFMQLRNERLHPTQRTARANRSLLTPDNNHAQPGECGDGLPLQNLCCAISGKTPEMSQYFSQLSNLANMTKICRRFRPVVERILHREICLPQLTSQDKYGFLEPLVALLARTLLDRPDLAQYVISLELWVRNRRLVLVDDLSTGLLPPHAYSAAFSKAADEVMASALVGDEQTRWLYALHSSDELALQAALIGRLTRLQLLTISGNFWRISSLDPRIRDDEGASSLPFLELALHHSPLTLIRIGGHVLANAFPVTTLTNLELDLDFFANRLTCLEVPLRLLNVTKLLVIASHIGPLAKFMPLAPQTSTSHDGLIVFMRESVPNINTFTVQSQTGTVPFRDTIYDSWGVVISPYHLDGPQDIEPSCLVNIEDGKYTWDWLTDALQPVQGQLLPLGLPPNWYSSTGNLAGALPCLQEFVSLATLSLPRVAIIPNRYGPDYVEEEDEFNAINFLPSSIKSLEVSQVDVEVLGWIQDLLRDDRGREYWLPHLSHVRLVFRDDYPPKIPGGFVEDVEMSGLKVTVV